MTARRPRRVSPDDFAVPPDPVAGALYDDRNQLADEVASVLRSLEGIGDDRIVASLWRMPDGGLGKFQWLEDLGAPIDIIAIRNAVKSKYGGGKYRLQIMVDKITKRNYEFHIAGDAKQNTPAGQPAVDTTNMFAMFLQMQAESRREQREMQQDMRREQMDYERRAEEARRDRNAALLQAATVVVPVLAPLLFNREKLSDVIALIRSNQPEPPGLKDQVETMVMIKKLLGDGDKEGFDPDNIVGSLARLAGPVIGAAGRALNGPRQDQAHPEGPSLDLAATSDGGLSLPPAKPPALAAGEPTSPLLAMLRPHVHYFFSTRIDPALAADAVVDIMLRQGVTQEDVNGLVAAFTLSPDWMADLASQGVDLRSDPEWANEFLSELVAAWTDRDRDGEPGTGGGGRVADPAGDAPPSAPGLTLDAHKADGA